MGIVLLPGTLNLNQIVENQAGSILDWYVFQQPLGALIFFIAATAEGGRTPFDLTEADSEIVAGFATEYSGMRFGFFFFAEYVNVFILSAMTAVLFLGGWNAPFDIDPLLDALGIATPVTIALDPAALGPGLLWVVAARRRRSSSASSRCVVWMLKSQLELPHLARRRLPAVQRAGGRRPAASVRWPSTSTGSSACSGSSAKTITLCAFFVLMRGTLPRVRIDQLMGFAWKWLVPAALLNIFVTAAAIVVLEQMGSPL